MVKYLLTGVLLLAILTSCNPDKKQETEPVKTKVEESTYFLKKGALMGIHFMSHKESYDAVENRLFLEKEYFPNWRDLIPESRVYYLRGERGMNKDKEVFLWIFEGVETRDKYWPEKQEASPLYTEKRKSIDWLYKDETFYKHNTGWEDSLSADYVVIEGGEPVKQDWLKKGALVGLHHMKLKPGIDTVEFEKFIQETWAPNRSDAVPGSKSFFLKGIRGDHENEYAFLFVFESVEARNKYWPEKDQSTKEYDDLRDKWKWIYEEEHRGKFFEGWDSEKQSDYIVVL